MAENPDMGELFRQAMAMQEQLVAAQAVASSTTVEGRAGGGLVRITMTGDGQPTGVTIDPEAVDPADVEVLEDLVLAALRDAVGRVQQLQAGAIGDLGGLGGLLAEPPPSG
jgi:DNA-binding YbaB/EbfC family protein